MKAKSAQTVGKITLCSPVVTHLLQRKEANQKEPLKRLFWFESPAPNRQSQKAEQNLMHILP